MDPQLIRSEVSCSAQDARDTTVFDFDRSTGETAAVETDADGDLSVNRKRRAVVSLCIHHHQQSSLSGVGLQLWRGGLLLSELVLSKLDSLQGVIALELGAGPGLPGLLLARVARRVFLTDIGAEVLEQCQANAQSNCSADCLFTEPVLVRELDWENCYEVIQAASVLNESQQTEPSESNDTDLLLERSTGQCASPFSWSPHDLVELRQIQVILAADVIYDNDLTDAFVHCAEDLMRAAPGKPSVVMFLAAEKRINFTLRDRAPRAHAFDYFLTLIQHPQDVREGQVAAATRRNLRGTRIPTDSVKQCVQYDRGFDFELWEIVWNESH